MNQNPSTLNKWFVCPCSNPDAEIRLFIFPYAGGSPAALSKWANEFPDNIELQLVHYPGRGSRYNDAPIKELAILVERVQQAIQPLLDKPFAFFGHSLGGLIAFELTRSLTQDNLPQPNVLFISACGAPHIPNPNSPIHALPDSEFLKALQEINGALEEVAFHSELMEYLLPTLRADFEVFERYVYSAEILPFDCPVVAFSGLDDQRVDQERIEGWGLHTNSTFKSQYFPGDHFFINTATEVVIASIVSELTAAYAEDKN